MNPIPRSIPEHLLPLLKTAAEMKANGHSFVTIAAKLGRNERNVRRWMERYPDAWAKLLFEACTESFQRVSGMAVTHLSHLMNDEDHPQRSRNCQFVYGKWSDLMLTIL